MAKILLADPDPAVRAAFHILLSRRLPGSMLQEVASWDELRQTMTAFQPDLLLLDWRLASSASGAGFRCLAAGCVHMRVVGMSIEASDRQPVLEAGADAFLYKGENPERVIVAIAEMLKR